MSSSRLPNLLLLLAVLVCAPAALHAQPLGVTYWQLAPFCNVVAVHVTQHMTPSGAVYALTGFDDQCGTVERAAVVGTATFNHDQSLTVGLTVVTTPGAAPVHVDARLNLASLSGAWTDSAGNAGTFVPLSPSSGARVSDRAAVAAGSPRPVPANGIAPGSITPAQIAPGAIGAAQIAPGAVGSGQIDPTQIQARVSETCPSGHAVRGINVDGTVVCEPQPVGPRAAYAAGDDKALVDTDTVVHSITLAVPSAGTVFVQASGNFTLLHSAAPGARTIVRARCSISLGTALEQGFETDVVMTVVTPDVVQMVPFGLTRGFDVAAGTFKANLVCTHFLQGSAGVDNPSLTAFFTPTP